MKCPFHAEEEVRLKPRGTPPLWPRCLAVRRFARRSAWSRPFVPDGGDRRLFAGSVLVVLCTDTFSPLPSTLADGLVSPVVFVVLFVRSPRCARPSQRDGS